MKGAPASEVAAWLPRANLTAGEREEMYALFERYFEGVARDQFARDLDEKNWVIQLHREGRLVGFSTLRSCDVEFDGITITAIYSGDTIVAPEAWGSSALARTWISVVNTLRAQKPQQRCYWLLLTSGFRTYRFLPVFWREFYPRFDLPTPTWDEQLMRRLAVLYYKNKYNENDGIVRFDRPQRLKALLREVPRGREVDPHIAFFLTRNSGWARGDELVCLTEIAEHNLTPAGRRVEARIEG